MEASVRAQVSFCPLFVTGRQVGGLASNLGVQSLNNLVVARAGLAPSPQVQTGVHRCEYLPIRRFRQSWSDSRTSGS